MKNSLNREIPDSILKEFNKEPFKGAFAQNGLEYTKAAPHVRAAVEPIAENCEGKLVKDLETAFKKAGLKDGMCISFHHHFRNGDYVAAKAMEVVHKMGVKDLTICATSLGKAQASLVPMIEDGTITGISSSGVRDKIGEAISDGKLKHPAVIRSHGGRVRAIEMGEVHIDIAVIGASSSDVLGNAAGKRGKSDCGVLSYADVDAKYADKVIVVTDTILPVPNFPSPIEAVDVDYVVKIDTVGDPSKIASGAIRMTEDPRELMMAEWCAQIVANTRWFKDGFSFQTGAGGPSLAVTKFLRPFMDKAGIKMGWGMGGITQPLVEMLHDGYVGALVDDQAFDIASVKSVYDDPRHFEISCSQYANPMNKGAFVNALDYVILGALEIDTNFNVNVVSGSDGTIQGAPGGHPDTAAGSKCSIIVAPLIRSRLATVCRELSSITTPGETVDVLVTDYGVAVNPLRKDILQDLEKTDLPLVSMEYLADKAECILGKAEPLQFDDQVVAIVEYRDGSIIDVIKKRR